MALRYTNSSQLLGRKMQSCITDYRLEETIRPVASMLGAKMAI